MIIIFQEYELHVDLYFLFWLYLIGMAMFEYIVYYMAAILKIKCV